VLSSLPNENSLANDFTYSPDTEPVNRSVPQCSNLRPPLLNLALEKRRQSEDYNSDCGRDEAGSEGARGIERGRRVSKKETEPASADQVFGHHRGQEG
jgi:hypothetical protein